MIKSHIQRWSTLGLTTFALLAAFGTYFCMYAFRKPFAVAQYEEVPALLNGLDFKIALIIAQVIGYALSKFVGIKVISEMKHRARPWLLISFILIAELALVGFGLSKGSGWSLVWLFLNGLPLGMIWGIVFSYLEGRRTSEVLGAGLCASFILSSGAVKSVGAWLMQVHQVDQFWMPALTGGIFLLPLFLFAYLLEQVPDPDQKDIEQRTAREPMTGQDRWLFFKRFAPGLVAMIIFYTLLTAYRDFRDNFAAEIWSAIGYSDAPYIFTISEIPIAVLALLMLGSTMLIKNNRKAFYLYHWIVGAGALLVGLTTYLFQQNLLRGDIWMVAVGAGLYVAYVPFNAIFFDRMIATFKYTATAGFLIYLADSFGYLGSVSMLLFKNFGYASFGWLEFFVSISYLVSAIGVLGMAVALVYFLRIK